MTDDSDKTDLPEECWSANDLEQAYRQALDAVEAVECNLGATLEKPEQDQADSVETHADSREPDSAEDADEDGGSPASHNAEKPADSPMAAPQAQASPDRLMPSPGSEAVVNEPLIQPRQVIEAALFVGGKPLSTKKLSSLLSGSFDHSSVEQLIDELNLQYASEGRPYEIRLGEGGYRLMLRSEYERIRHRVYGLGPKEVRLSQDALEILALIAYKQPLTKQEIEDFGKRNPGGILRQLLRRELIAIQRGEKGRRDVSYRTTPRFLELFGLGNIEELPMADELSLK